VSRPIDFPALVFLLLLALILLLSGSAILSRASRPTSSSDRALDGAAADKASLGHEKASLVQPQIVTLCPDPAEIRVSANYQAVDSFVDAAINKAMRRLRRVQRHLKDRAHQSRHRPIMANLVSRIHSWLVGEFGLAYRTNGRAMERKSDKWTKAQKAAHGSTYRGSRIQGSRAELN